MASRFGEEIKGEVKKIWTSSANKHSLCRSLPSFRPWIFGLQWIRRARGSISRAKRSGERGKPWRVPCSMGKGSERNPE